MRTSLNKSRTLGNTLLYQYLRKVQRISPPIFRTIPCIFCVVIETFLLEQNLAKRTKASMAIKWFPCKKTRNDFTACWPLIGQKNTKNFWHQSELRITWAVWNWSGKNLSPGALLALLCFSSSPFSFARFDFPLPPRSAPGSPRMMQAQFWHPTRGMSLWI